MSENKLYIGNVSWGMDEDALAQACGEYGTVTSTHIVKDRETGRSRGFGFVEMSTDEEALAVIEGLNGAMMDGRNLTVNVARPREDRGGGGGGGGGYRGGRR